MTKPFSRRFLLCAVALACGALVVAVAANKASSEASNTTATVASNKTVGVAGKTTSVASNKTASVASSKATGVARNSTAAREQAVVNPACGPRLRKSWDMLTPAEQELYVRAVAQTMDDGLYIKFVEVHTERMTTAEAHRTCMFIYWHRALLLGFENLLRSYGGEFSCITIPYWNYVDHNALFLQGACNSMEECSPILGALGGSMAGQPRTVVINGTPVQGNCVGAFPVNHFCEASHLSGPMCSGCVPRGDWSTAGFPATTTVSSLMRQLFTSPTMAGVASNIERGIHNTIHNALDGAMGFLEAPADPIFFSHHATLDLLHSIYHKCLVGSEVPLPIEVQLDDPRIFSSCARRESLGPGMPDGDVLMPQSSIMLRSGEQGTTADSVFDSMNVLSPYFAGLPTVYAGLADIRNLGAFSYNYQLAGLLGDMFSTCAGPTLLGNLGNGQPPFARRLEASEEKKTTPSGWIEAVIVPSNHSSDWYAEALAAAVAAANASSPGQQVVEALEDVEKMTCLFYDECRGGVRDFSDRFRRNFHMTGEATCKTVVNAVAAGRDSVRTPGWRGIFGRHIDCKAGRNK